MPLNRIWMFAALCTAALAAPLAAGAQCVGDCNADGSVAINELVSGVNIALGQAAVSTCVSIDANADGTVAINEVIAAVNNALNGCPTTGGAICGDSTKDEAAGEECDDGNNIGGDGCAANCTNEVRRTTQLDPDRAKATVQLASLSVPLKLKGTQALITGKPRSGEVRGKNGDVLFKDGEVPIVVKAEDVQFDPISIPGLLCACVRGVVVDSFGPGISGVGKAGCGEQGLSDIDFLVEEDHDVTPGSPGNSGPASGLPDDPECNDVVDAGGGVSSQACLEGTGADCSTPNNSHLGVCNSAHVYHFSGGQAPRGSVLLTNSTAIGQLMDGGACAETRKPNGDCKFADYGPDCLPCTDDDLQKGTPSVGPTTSGTAQVALYDANDSKGLTLKDGSTCGGTAPCVAKVSGSITDCDALIADPNAPLNGSLATASATLDSSSGDSLVTTTLAAKQN